MMQAMVYSQYGAPDVLSMQQVDKPVPKDNEVLVKMHATAVTSGDARLRSLNVPVGFKTMTRLVLGITKPRHGILGIDLAGEIEAIGKAVTQFKVGDKVFGSGGSGAYAQYLTIAQDGCLSLMPENMSYQEAAAVPFGALSSLVFLRDMGNIKSGQKVLVNGASGGLGTFAIQLAKHFGCEVTGVCSGPNAQLVKDLGADHSIDYTKENFCQGNKQYDIVYDTIGNVSFGDCKRVLTPKGRAVLAVAGLPVLLTMLKTSLLGGKQVKWGVAMFKANDLEFVKTLITQGKLKSTIDQVYPLTQLPQAHAHVDKGHKKGAVVISI